MSTIRNVCVYCGSSPGNNPEFIDAARQFGQILAQNGINLVYGGGSFGLMGAVATAVLDHGGTVTGVIPKSLVERERALHRVQEMVVTADMHERKRIMFERSDAFVALPGGLGTLEELVEQLTWVQLVHHTKPVVLLSIRGFWTPLLALFERMNAQGFIYNAPILDNLICEETAEVLPTIERKLLAVSA
ncbi:MAG: TIGR00730 family Rossman fold protein [Pseudomonadota bacterium]